MHECSKCLQSELLQTTTKTFDKNHIMKGKDLLLQTL